MRAIRELEEQLFLATELSLDEAMIICCISSDRLSSSHIAQMVGLKPAHNSKVLGSLEKKNLIDRSLDFEDKRKMFFNLSPSGKKMLTLLQELKFDVPLALKAIFPIHEGE